jgi:pyridoxamine 5'-phosphate oxidase
MNIADIRKDYALRRLDESDAHPDPFRLFQQWLDEAIRAEAAEPTAMTLATADASGRPAARIVLLKGLDERGFVFFTNYESRKGADLAARPAAALAFFWKELERQVRIEGAVEKVSNTENDAYYLSRPLGSRIGAWASPQSQRIDNREWLEERVREAQTRLGDDPARPPHWGGYRVVPDRIEFWQGRQSRLHDRIAYEKRAGAWVRARLAP